MRLDKWLWAARFFKTRALAAKACELGRVECNSVKAKPAKEIKAGDLLLVKNEAGVFAVEVLGLSEMRGPPATAQGLYRETAESLELRKIAAEERKAGISVEGRPSKKDRRERQRFLGR